jgi:hypothetical protein
MELVFTLSKAMAGYNFVISSSVGQYIPVMVVYVSGYTYQHPEAA